MIGYGSQGHAQAQNLKDSGVDVVVGLRDGSPQRAKAEAAGLRVASPSEAAKQAGLIAILVPDTAQAKLYGEAIAPNLEQGRHAVLFARFQRAFRSDHSRPSTWTRSWSLPRARAICCGANTRLDVACRRCSLSTRTPPGNAWDTALAYADGIGSTRAGTLRTSFAEETETDLFGEQAVLCGGVSALMRAGFDTLVAAGYQPEVAYFECVHELKLIVDLIYEGGLTGMRNRVSDTAEYGDYIAGDRVIGEHSRAAMQGLLEDIRSGTFARQWVDEAKSGGKNFETMRSDAQDHLVEEVGVRLRSQMAWMEQKP